MKTNHDGWEFPPELWLYVVARLAREPRATAQASTPDVRVEWREALPARAHAIEYLLDGEAPDRPSPHIESEE